MAVQIQPFIRFRSVLARVAYEKWRFRVGQDGDRCFLQVRFDAPSNTLGGEPVVQHGRKWFLSPHMTDSEVVGTALKAVLTAVEHEAREKFKYRDRAIFGMHFDIERLVELAGEDHAAAKRGES